MLAYELVVGRAPFEVKDETQTATMIMFSNKLNFPSAHSLLWVDFVKQVGAYHDLLKLEALCHLEVQVVVQRVQMLGLLQACVNPYSTCTLL